MLRFQDIEQIKWEVTSGSWGDDGSVYQGNMTVYLTDGSVKTASLDWVREAYSIDFTDGDIEALVNYEGDYGEIQFK